MGNYEFIDTMRLDTAECAFPVTFMCEGLHVPTYEWRSRPESATAQRREELKILIKKAFDLSDATYGYRRVHAQLQRWDVAVGLELVRELMRAMRLEPCQPRPKRVSLTKATAGPIPDLVGRNFTAAEPGTKLVGDTTYIATGEGRLYLATVLDCCTKEVIEYAMDDHYQTPLISRAIRNAARNRELAAAPGLLARCSSTAATQARSPPGRSAPMSSIWAAATSSPRPSSAPRTFPGVAPRSGCTRLSRASTGAGRGSRPPTTWTARRTPSGRPRRTPTARRGSWRTPPTGPAVAAVSPTWKCAAPDSTST
ncbi:hypothetical protein FCI23_46480 [Actinacidiphila oryziradicis]|uniref:HTH-like domain-containing protein n=1 Tax=Actinacidiphila oryziradicis TaxID=2571141 RepID=A0A4U0SG86_9ACTN|nr:hypothetical protein FCI23_46480 [Actinacidiphila oryziradicis]